MCSTAEAKAAKYATNQLRFWKLLELIHFEYLVNSIFAYCLVT